MSARCLTGANTTSSRQFYQKGFARQQGKGWYAVVLDRARGHARPASNIRDILAERDYNTIIDADGNRDFRAEQMLAEHVETASAPGLEALRAGTFPLSDIDRQQVATFMAAQLTRGRAIRNNFTEALSEVMSMALSLTAQNASDEHFESVLGHPLTAGERERLLHNREHMTTRPTNAVVLRALLAPIGDVADLLLMRTWTLVAFPTPCLFTGEHPVVHINPPASRTATASPPPRGYTCRSRRPRRWCSPIPGRTGRRASFTAPRNWPAA